MECSFFSLLFTLLCKSSKMKTNFNLIKEYRNKNIGTELLTYVKSYLAEQKCELIFVWPSDKSVRWYSRNGFSKENEIFECALTEE